MGMTHIFSLFTFLEAFLEGFFGGFFGGPAFFQPIRVFENISDFSDWLEKSRPSKKATFVMIM